MYKFKWLIVASVLFMLLVSGASIVLRAHAANGQDTLNPGETLTAGQELISQGGAYTLIMQGDGNLVEYDSSGHALWASGTGGNPGSYLANQTDGNIVLYAPGSRAIWTTMTGGYLGTALVLQADANLVAYAGRTPMWARFGMADTLYPGQTLTAGQRLVSQGGAYTLIMQGDGNLVEYNSSGHALWASGTGGYQGQSVYAVNQSADGNVVLYTQGGQALWETNTSGYPGTVFVQQSDANLVAYATYAPPGTEAIWSSRCCAEPDNAIQWYMARMGSSSYENWCEAAVENAYGANMPYTSALANWDARVQNGQAHYPYTTAPHGALVFYHSSGVFYQNGHVAISLGNGQVISTSVNGHIGIVPISYFSNPLGWAYEPW